MGRVFYIRFRKKTDGIFLLFVGFLAVATIACILFGGSDAESIVAERTPAIKGVATDDSIYAVTVIIDSQNKNDIRLVLEACEGYGITPTCFMDVAWIAANKDYARSVCTECIPGILVSTDFSNYTRGEIMSYMAVMNDKYMSLTGAYPKYVRYDGKNEGALSSVLSAYGQYYISAETVLSDTSVQIRGGSITEILPQGDETVYALAKSVATAVANSLKAVSLSDMLYPADNEVNANGYQYQ